MMSRWWLREQVLDGAMRADGKVEEYAVTTVAGMSSCGGGRGRRDYWGGGGRREASSSLRRRRRRVGSSPSAGATLTDAAMPLSPPTNDGDNHNDEGEGRRDLRGGGGDKGHERSVDDARRESGER